MSWTDEKVEELKRLWSEGITTGEIGRRLNMSKNSVVGKVHRLGLSGRPSPIKKKEDQDDDLFVKKPKATVKSSSKASPRKEKSSSDVKKSDVKNETKTTELKKDKEEKKVVQPKVAIEKPNKPVQEKKITDIIEEPEEADIKLVQSLETARKEPSPKGFVSLTDLDNHTCRWPIGDPKDENFHFCGKKVRSGQTYCEEHAVIAYVKPTKK